jgi:hypothetical protein
VEITRQADYYGLPDNAPTNVPPAERLADILSKPTPWSGPSRVAGEHDAPQWLDQQLNNPYKQTTGEMGRTEDEGVPFMEKEFLREDDPNTPLAPPHRPRHQAAPLEPNSQQKIQQGMQNTMPEPPEPWEAPDYTNGKPL